jgi:peptide/nickel transport system substrate-binding protein
MVFNVKPGSFKEAPILSEKVKKGELPPLSRRLPEDYAVIQPGSPQGIGKYGGTWKSVFVGPADEQNVERIIHNHLLFWTADLTVITPHIFKGYEASADSKVFTFRMRKGMKWSDGQLFTADDVIFWYEDILLNDDLLPAKFGWARAGGKLGVWKKVDDLTFTVTFEVPYGLFPDQAASLQVGSNISQLNPCGGMISPKHYMKQFHAKYVGLEQANKLAKDAGFDNWAKMFCTKNNPLQNPEAPSTAAWVPRTGFNTQQAIFERNPYYWAVDTEGNQLPYIDRITFDLVQNLEVLNLRAIAGDFTTQNRHLDVAKLPVFIENQKKGNYQVVLDKSPQVGGSQTGIAFNQDWEEDPELATFIRNADFRRALSLAVDRNEINEVFFLGQARPASTCTFPDPPYEAGPEYDQKYSTLDPVKANQLLDSIGLAKRDSEGFRLLPSGKRLELKVLTPGGTFQDWPGQLEMVGQHWKKHVGIKSTVDVADRTLREKRLRANEAMLAVWGINGSAGLWLFPENSFAWDWFSMMAPMSGQWFQDNKIWRQPTGKVREMQLIYEKATQSKPEDRIALGKELHRIRCEEVFYIGTVSGGGLGSMWIINEDMAPIPRGIIGSVHGQNPGSVWTETWYYKSGQAGVPAN